MDCTVEKQERILILRKRKAYLRKRQQQATTKRMRKRYMAQLELIDAVLEELKSL